MTNTGRKSKSNKPDKTARRFQKKIGKKFNKYKWKRERITNECKTESMKLNKTQKFLKEYFVPKRSQKGLILYHSVGSGKTCAAIAMATNFEDAGYSIVWVTRNSIKNVIYQNLFGDFICHPKIDPSKLGDNPQKRFGHFNKVTNKAWLKPVSYRSFSNISKKKNKLYKELVKRNGERDPLKNTLVIIDEAHNFTTMKAIGFSKHESAKFVDIKNMIHDSYMKSGDDSVRLLLLSATPGLNGVTGALNMFNLLLNPDNQLPTNTKSFSQQFLNKNLSEFSKEGRREFAKVSRKFVSFLDTTKDYTKFAKRVFETYNDPLSKDRSKIKEKLQNARKMSQTDHCKISNVNKELNNILKLKGLTSEEKQNMIQEKLDINIADKRELKILFKDYKKILKDCVRFNDKKLQENCEKNVKNNIEKGKKTLKEIAKLEAEKCKHDFKNKKQETIEKLKEKLRKNHLVTEYNQEDALKRCKEKGMSKEETIKCLKKVLLWNDTFKQMYKFDSKKFDENKLNEILPIVSAKFYKLIKTIKELDKKDKCTDKKTYKHVIFLEDDKYMKILISVMFANDFKLAFKLKETERMRKNKKVKYKSLDLVIPSKPVSKRKSNLPNLKNKVPKTPKPKPYNYNFAVLTKTGIYQRHIGKNFATKIKNKFNERPDNIHGENIRFILMDKNFLEGISFFDVKYLHILTKPQTDFQLEQLVGRVIRRCGHKGLPMEKDGGWKVNVMLYQNYDKKHMVYDEIINDMELEKELKDLTDTEKTGRIGNIHRVITVEMENNAFDKKLTEKIHKNFNVLFDTLIQDI